MKKVKVDYVGSNVLIIGQCDSIIDIGYIKIFLNDFDYSINSDGNIVLPNISEDELNELYNELEEMLTSEGFIFENTSNLHNSIKKIKDTKNKFLEFSDKAREIRNNIINNEDFKIFLDIVEKKFKTRKLYRLQYLSAFHLAFAQNACNFSVPGSGKTSIVYGAYSYLNSKIVNRNKYVDKILVISPLSAFGPWEEEYYQCFDKRANTMRISGETSKKEKERYFYSTNVDEITMISYHSTINLKNEIIYFLKNNNVLLVLDEAHKIKNTSGGIISETVLEFSDYAKAKFVLTGTPAPNGYEDLYNLFHFIWPNQKIIKYSINQLSNISNRENDRRIDELIDSIKPFFIRIKKSDMENMPVPIENDPIIVEQGLIQSKIYNFINRSIIYDYDKGVLTDYKKNLIKSKLIRLMQAASNPATLSSSIKDYFADTEVADESITKNNNMLDLINNYYDYEVPPKFVESKRIIQEILEKKGKVVIWTTFVENLKSLSSFLEKAGIKNLTIYGETPIEKNYQEVLTREEVIENFKKSSKYNVLITNPFAVAESISLHKVCKNAIYFERTFNAGHIMQSKDRIHRFGLNANDEINYYYLVTENSIDEKIHEVLDKKIQRMEEIIESDEIPLFKNLNDEAIDDEVFWEIIRDYEKL